MLSLTQDWFEKVLMEQLNQKSIERVVSQKALQMGSSFPCQICVVGFLCGVCLTSLFLAALTSFATFQFGPILFSTMSMAESESTSLNNTSKSISRNFKTLYFTLIEKIALGKQGRKRFFFHFFIIHGYV